MSPRHPAPRRRTVAGQHAGGSAPGGAALTTRFECPHPGARFLLPNIRTLWRNEHIRLTGSDIALIRREALPLNLVSLVAPASVQACPQLQTCMPVLWARCGEPCPCTLPVAAPAYHPINPSEPTRLWHSPASLRPAGHAWLALWSVVAEERSCGQGSTGASPGTLISAQRSRLLPGHDTIPCAHHKPTDACPRGRLCLNLRDMTGDHPPR